MKKLLLLSAGIFFVFSLHVSAQKTTERTNLSFVPVRQSVLTGLDLPPMTKRSSQADSLVIIKDLLQQHAGPYKSKTTKVEIFYVSGDSIVTRLTRADWKITPDPDDKRFFWITKNNRNLLVYYVRAETDGHLYFAELDRAPKGLRR